jgi:hypothetical protein
VVSVGVVCGGCGERGERRERRGREGEKGAVETKTKHCQSGIVGGQFAHQVGQLC